MFLKLKYKDTVKKIKFVEKYQEISKIHDLIKESLSIDQFRIYFIDCEDEQIFIDDKHDLEYFIDQTKD